MVTVIAPVVAPVLVTVIAIDAVGVDSRFDPLAIGEIGDSSARSGRRS